jgi:hypothetical protein
MKSTFLAGDALDQQPSAFINQDAQVFSSENPWVRIASSAHSRVEDPLKVRGALGAGCARLQTIIIRRKRGEFGDV